MEKINRGSRGSGSLREINRGVRGGGSPPGTKDCHSVEPRKRARTRNTTKDFGIPNWEFPLRPRNSEFRIRNFHSESGFRIRKFLAFFNAVPNSNYNPVCLRPGFLTTARWAGSLNAAWVCFSFMTKRLTIGPGCVPAAFRLSIPNSEFVHSEFGFKTAATASAPAASRLGCVPVESPPQRE